MLLLPLRAWPIGHLGPKRTIVSAYMYVMSSKHPPVPAAK